MKLNEIELNVLRRLLNRGGDILGDHKAEASLLEKIFKKPKLSILICHLTDRKELLERLMKVLRPQVDAADGDVEICIEEDEGKISTGEKRNRLLDKATGIMVAAVDDDDTVSCDYCSRIIAAFDSNPNIDCIGIEGLLWRDTTSQRFIHSLKYDHWYEEAGVYLRSPNHLNPIKRELALQVKFLPIVQGEDHDFSKRILPLLKTEIHLGETAVYNYFP